MHRRARHLNARDAGATMVLDARFVSGSDGDAIQTWASRTTSTYDVTQSTSSKRALLKLGANGINGQACIQFDGTDDYYVGVNENVGDFTVIYTARNTNRSDAPVSQLRIVLSHVNSTDYKNDVSCGYYNNTNAAYCQKCDNVTFPSAWSYDATTGEHVVTNRYSGTTAYIRVDMKTETSATTGTATNINQAWTLGTSTETGFPNGVAFFDSKMGAVVFFKSQSCSDPLSKRLSHSQGFSFKITCS